MDHRSGEAKAAAEAAADGWSKAKPIIKERGIMLFTHLKRCFGWRLNRTAPTDYEMDVFRDAEVKNETVRAYLSWRRSQMLCSLPVLLTSAATGLSSILMRDNLTDEGNFVYNLPNIANFILLLAVAGAVGLPSKSYRVWPKWRLSSKIMRIGFIISFILPIIPAIIPLRYISKEEAIPDAGIAGAATGLVVEALPVSGGQVQELRALDVQAGLENFIAVMPVLVSFPSALLAGSLRIRGLLPESALSSWILTTSAPFLSIIILAVAVIIIQFGGDVILMLGVLIRCFYPWLYVFGRHYYVKPPTEAREKRVDLIQFVILALNIVSLALITYWMYARELVKREEATIYAQFVLEIWGRVLATMVVFSDIFLRMTMTNWRVERATRGLDDKYRSIEKEIRKGGRKDRESGDEESTEGDCVSHGVPDEAEGGSRARDGGDSQDDEGSASGGGDCVASGPRHAQGEQGHDIESGVSTEPSTLEFANDDDLTYSKASATFGGSHISSLDASTPKHDPPDDGNGLAVQSLPVSDTPVQSPEYEAGKMAVAVVRDNTAPDEGTSPNIISPPRSDPPGSSASCSPAGTSGDSASPSPSEIIPIPLLAGRDDEEAIDRVWQTALAKHENQESLSNHAVASSESEEDNPSECDVVHNQAGQAKDNPKPGEGKVGPPHTQSLSEKEAPRQAAVEMAKSVSDESDAEEATGDTPSASAGETPPSTEGTGRSRRWAELDRLDAEAAAKRAELERLEQLKKKHERALARQKSAAAALHGKSDAGDSSAGRPATELDQNDSDEQTHGTGIGPDAKEKGNADKEGMLRDKHWQGLNESDLDDSLMKGFSERSL